MCPVLPLSFSGVNQTDTALSDEIAGCGGSSNSVFAVVL